MKILNGKYDSTLKEIVLLHTITKRYILLGEETDVNFHSYLQPIKEFRDSYVHILRIFKGLLFMEKYRVVLTCWEYKEPKPYADDLSGVALSLFSSEEDALEAIQKSVADELKTLNEGRVLVPVEDSDGNVVGYDYDFRSDRLDDHDNIVRFWDGADYQNVTAYDIYKLTGDSEDLNKCSYYKYRGCYILPNSDYTSFRVEQFDTTILKCKELKRL